MCCSIAMACVINVTGYMVTVVIPCDDNMMWCALVEAVIPVVDAVNTVNEGSLLCSIMWRQRSIRRS